MNSVEIMTAKEARELLNNNGIEFSNSVLNNLKEIGYECYITIQYNERHKQDIYALHMDW